MVSYLGRSTCVVACLALLGGALAACNKHKPAAPNAAVRGTDEQIFIGDTIEKNYDANVIMKRAEAFFDKEEYAEAIIEYQHFLDLHRVHTLAPYAQYKLAESHFKMFKTIDRDPEPIYKAIEHYEKLLKAYPGSRYEHDATQRIRDGHDLLAQISFMVGEFYQRQEAWLAAAHRFEYVVTTYPEMNVASDALYHLALVYHELRAYDWAKEKLVALAERYPNNKHQAEAQRLLAKLSNAPPPPVAERRHHEAAGPQVAGLAAVEADGSSAPAGAPVTLCRLGVRCSDPEPPAVVPAGAPSGGANGRAAPAPVTPAVVPVSLANGTPANGSSVNGHPANGASSGAAAGSGVTLCRLGVRCSDPEPPAVVLAGAPSGGANGQAAPAPAVMPVVTPVNLPVGASPLPAGTSPNGVSLNGSAVNGHSADGHSTSGASANAASGASGAVCRIGVRC
jgi:outer membrane protein assembly factor BamD